MKLPHPQELLKALNETGYHHFKGCISPAEAIGIRNYFEEPALFRSTIDMKRYQFGSGTYKYFNYPLPQPVADLRRLLYPALTEIANKWAQNMGKTNFFPEKLEEFLELCHTNGQLRPTPLLLYYTRGDFNTLHQDLYGDLYFPIQAMIMLSRKGVDFEGGHFVLTEQRPRAQSKAMVVEPDLGDLVCFAVNERPVDGTRGVYRVKLRHGVSPVLKGERYTIGIIFHDAK